MDRIEKKYLKMINDGKSFKEVFKKVSKKNDYDIFENILLSDKVPESFSMDIFRNYTYNTMFSASRDANNTKEAQYLKKVYIDNIAKNFGQEVGDKLKTLYKDNNIKLFDMYRLSSITCNGQVESKKVSELIDLLSDDSINVGIHRTHASDIGDTISNEGLDLTSHSLHGAFDDNYMLGKRELNNNITLDTSIAGIYDIMIGGTYKNFINPATDKYFLDNVDIVVTAIPKDLFSSNNSDIIINEGDVEKLNPKYIKGYYTVHPNDETLSLGKYTPNDKCVVTERKIDVKSHGDISSYWNNLFVSRKKNSFSLTEKFKSLFSKNKKLASPKIDFDDSSQESIYQNDKFYNNLKDQVVSENQIKNSVCYDNFDNQIQNKRLEDIYRR